MEGVGGAGSAGSNTGTQAPSPPQQGAGTENHLQGTGSINSTDNHPKDTSTKEVSDQGSNGITININHIDNTNMYTNMCTEDSLKLHNNNSIAGSAETQQIDLEKMIELIMIMKLLESMNEQG